MGECEGLPENTPLTAVTFNPLPTARELEAAGIERRQAETIAHPSGPSGYTLLRSHRPRRTP